MRFPIRGWGRDLVLRILCIVVVVVVVVVEVVVRTEWVDRGMQLLT